MKIKDAKFVIVDVETTGMQAQQDRIIEIGAVRMQAEVVEATFATLVDPDCRIPRQITRITGIKPSDVIGAPQAFQVLPDFVEFMEDAIFVAHNCSFDSKFIAAELNRARLPALPNKRLCTVRLARRLLPGLPSRSLGSLIKFFELDPSDRHRALSDAIATQQVLTRLLKKLEIQYEITDLEDLLHFQNRRYKRTTANQMRQARVLECLKDELPASPGIYQMKSREGKLLYIGKAKVLSERVRSYFSGTEGHASHIREMVRKVHDVKWKTTSTEVEAILLESQLIKEYTPPFNKVGRAYHHRSFLRLGSIANAGWVTLIKHIRADGARHYGPFASRNEAILLAQAIVALYGDSPDSFRTPERVGVGLETAQIGGPLTNEGFSQAIAFLEGRDPNVLKALAHQIQEASMAQEYELAAQRHKWLKVMELIYARPSFMRTALLDRTGAVLYTMEDKTEIHFMAYGCPVAHVVWPCDDDLFHSSKAEFHARAKHSPERLSVQQVDAISLLGMWMFKELKYISVLPMRPDDLPSEFDATLEALLP